MASAGLRLNVSPRTKHVATSYLPLEAAILAVAMAATVFTSTVLAVPSKPPKNLT